MSDKEIEIYLHDLARGLSNTDLRVIADRFAELAKKERDELKYSYN